MMDDKNVDFENAIVIDFPPMPQEKDYVVCYIDFLGTKKMIQEKEQSIFNMIYESISVNVEIYSKLERFGDLQFKVFSDNILIAHEIGDITDEYQVLKAYKNVISFLSPFCSNFIKQGVLFRGGITVGKLAINSVMVWGDALVETVNIEENISIYPRIVISDKLLGIFDRFNLDQSDFEEKFCCLKDADGCVFIDYIFYDEPPYAQSTIEAGYSVINEKIKTEKSPKILQKYIWHKTYLERAKENFNEYWYDTFHIDFVDE